MRGNDVFEDYNGKYELFIIDQLIQFQNIILNFWNEINLAKNERVSR